MGKLPKHTKAYFEQVARTKPPALPKVRAAACRKVDEVTLIANLHERAG